MRCRPAPIRPTIATTCPVRKMRYVPRLSFAPSDNFKSVFLITPETLNELAALSDSLKQEVGTVDVDFQVLDS